MIKEMFRVAQAGVNNFCAEFLKNPLGCYVKTVKMLLNEVVDMYRIAKEELVAMWQQEFSTDKKQGSDSDGKDERDKR